MIIDVIKLTQPIGVFYLGKMQARDLYKLAKTDIVDMKKESSLGEGEDTYVGNQRQLNEDKVKQIKMFLATSDAVFPASIVLNLKKGYLKAEGKDYIEIEEKEDTFWIIDGQHRLAGFDDYSEEFDMPVSIFVGLNESKQTWIFNTINTTQTKVNPSLSLYMEKNNLIMNPRKWVVQMADMFATDIKSPLRGKIKYNVQNEDVNKDVSNISLITFCSGILQYIYDDDSYYIVREAEEKGSIDKLEFKNYILWEYYKEKKLGTLYKILFNYFNSIRKVFRREWDDRNSILVKSTGYNAFMKLFGDLYKIGFDEGNLTEDFFDTYLSKIADMSGKFNTEFYGGSGWSASTQLYRDLCNHMHL